MKKLCKFCLTTQTPIISKLEEKELINFYNLGLHTSICETCYLKVLTNQLDPLKSELTTLREERDNTKLAYYEAYAAWKEKADLFKMIDYNLSIIQYNINKAKAKTKQPRKKKPNKKFDTKKLAQKILANLTPEQQIEVIKTLQAH